MQQVKNGLVALSMLLSSACAHERVFTVSSLYNSPPPREEFIVKVTSNGIYEEVGLIMSKEGYSIITSDDDCYFRGNSNSGFLRWDNRRFYDNDMDGTLDAVREDSALSSPVDIFYRLQPEYTARLNELNQLEIHELWLRRWVQNRR